MNWLNLRTKKAESPSKALKSTPLVDVYYRDEVTDMTYSAVFEDLNDIALRIKLAPSRALFIVESKVGAEPGWSRVARGFYSSDVEFNSFEEAERVAKGLKAAAFIRKKAIEEYKKRVEELNKKYPEPIEV